MGRLACLALACVMLAGTARAGAIVEGTVRIPPAEPLPPAKPRYPVTASYVVGEPDPPAAIVFLDGTFPASSRAERAVVAQRQYQFAPGLLAVRRGTLIDFPNLDDEYHSVFSYSRAKRFDLGRYPKDDQPPAIPFDESGVVKVYCEIHDHMRATVLVLDTPYFEKTDADGRYRLANLPTGEFLLKAWLNDETVLERRVALRDGATLRIDFPGE